MLASPPPRSRPAMIALLCVAQFVVVLDATIVAIALPAIQRSLHVATADLQWVVSAYTLAFAGFLVLAGRLADLHGRRLVLMRPEPVARPARRRPRAPGPRRGGGRSRGAGRDHGRGPRRAGSPPRARRVDRRGGRRRRVRVAARRRDHPAGRGGRGGSPPP